MPMLADFVSKTHFPTLEALDQVQQRSFVEMMETARTTQEAQRVVVDLEEEIRRLRITLASVIATVEEITDS